MIANSGKFQVILKNIQARPWVMRPSLPPSAKAGRMHWHLSHQGSLSQHSAPRKLCHAFIIGQDMDTPVPVVVRNQSVHQPRPTPGRKDFDGTLTVQGRNGSSIEQLQNCRPGILLGYRIMKLEGEQEQLLLPEQQAA